MRVVRNKKIYFEAKAHLFMHMFVDNKTAPTQPLLFIQIFFSRSNISPKHGCILTLFLLNFFMLNLVIFF